MGACAATSTAGGARAGCLVEKEKKQKGNFQYFVKFTVNKSRGGTFSFIL